jgi:hypothetical protein
VTWGKVDDKLHSSPKWRGCSKGARALWVTSLSWCMDQLTDGRVPVGMLAVLDGTKREAGELVRVGLWETVEGGWVFHDWSEYQPDAASVKAKRIAESVAGAEGNHIRWHEKRGITVDGCEFCRPKPSGTRSGKRRVPDRGGDSGAIPPGPDSPPNPPDPYPYPNHVGVLSVVGDGDQESNRHLGDVAAPGSFDDCEEA